MQMDTIALLESYIQTWKKKQNLTRQGTQSSCIFDCIYAACKRTVNPHPLNFREIRKSTVKMPRSSASRALHQAHPHLGTNCCMKVWSWTLQSQLPRQANAPTLLSYLSPRCLPHNPIYCSQAGLGVGLMFWPLQYWMYTQSSQWLMRFLQMELESPLYRRAYCKVVIIGSLL